MRKLLAKFTDEYMLMSENSQLGKDERRTINNPIVYLFVGDQSLAALKVMYRMNQKKWSNHNGIIYLHAYEEQTWEADNVFCFKAIDSYDHGKRSRPSIHENFYQNQEKLMEYNQLLRQINSRLSVLGVRFNSFQNVNIAVITHIDDRLTVILPELTILLENSLQDLFTMHYLDAFCLLEEKILDEDKAAMGVSFLLEINRWQQPSFSFSKEIHVTKDKVRMNVTRNNRPLFDFVYLLSDKDEHGMFTENSMHKNYELISTINMMKNKELSESHHFSGNETYNNVQFLKNIQSEEGIPAFMTAGFSKVSRPNEAIAMNVLSFFYSHIMRLIRDRSKTLELSKVFEMLELDEASIYRTVNSFVPSEEMIDEMLVLMPSYHKYKDLKDLALKEIEAKLFGQSTQDFFEDNFVKPAKVNQEKYQLKHHLKDLLTKRVEENPKFGVYSAFQWSAPDYVQYLMKLKVEYSNHIDTSEAELDQLYEESGNEQKFKKAILSEKATTRSFIAYFLKKIYILKREILFMKSKLMLVMEAIDFLEKAHQEYEEQIIMLESLEKTLRERAEEVTSGTKSRINQNIPEYYEKIVDKILKDVATKHTINFYFEDKTLGKYSELLKKGTFIERVLEMCQRHLFASEELNQSFEAELLERANIKLSYGDPQVLTKDELFSEIYQLLEKDSSCQIHLLEYGQKHKYEEKYYFGDYESNFIQYALGIEKDNRAYRLGCIHEKRTSGIEKITLMGGFTIGDLRFYQNNVRYYEKYQENDFGFHPEPASIPS